MAKAELNTGNFTLVVEGEYNAESQVKAISNALKYELQRDVASKVYAEVAGVANAEGKKQLPKDFERDSVEFSDESADAMRLAAEAALKDRGSFTVSVTKYEGSEAASPMKRATTFVESLMNNGDEEQQLRSTLALFDARASDGTKDILIEIANKAGIGIQPPKEKKG